jgi:hypothetical protein
MMNDETEQFERRLSHQPMRQVPRELRAEILSATKHVSRPASHASFFSTLNHQLSTLFWPHPKAWAALAAVWIFIFALNFSMRDKLPMVAEKVSPPSPEVVAELRQQKLLFAQLIGSSDAEPPKFFPRPRTERVEILTA